MKNMTTPSQTNQEVQQQEVKQDTKEYNFAQIRKQLENERSARVQAEEKAAQLMAEMQRMQSGKEDDDEVDDEPYVDKRRLKKELGKVVKQTIDETDNRIQNAVQSALVNERKNMWLKSNPDFYEVMQHAQTFADRDPELAETILEMPEGFERQKLVYKSIKAMGIHKPPEVKSGVQDKIEQNRRSPYYQPSGMASPGYGISNGGKDYSEADGKNAYAKMQDLKKRLRIW